MSALLTVEIRRMLADRRFLLLMILLPIAMYLLFTNLFGGNAPNTGLDPDVALMVSMAAMGSIGAAMTATAPRIAQERGNGWLRQLRLLPISGRAVVGAKVLAAMIMSLPAIVLVDLTAVLDHGVTLPWWQWFAIGGLLWVGTAPFAALGAFLGWLADDAAAFAVMYAVLLFLSAVGGLWMPLSVLPHALQDIGRALPSNRFAELGWSIAAGGAPRLSDFLVLAGWLVLFAGLAGLAYRRRQAR